MTCNDTLAQYWYAGYGEWRVMVGDREPPCLGVTAMVHELAHWLAASNQQRWLVNFGLDADPGADAVEDTTLMVERGLQAAMMSCSNVVAMALGGRR